MIRRLPIVALVAVALSSSLTACKKDPNDMALQDLSPRAGAMQVEQPVTITGRFRTDIGYTVYFGTERSQRVSVRDDETMVAVAPTSERPGPVDITIIADNGPAFKIAHGYAYEGTQGAGWDTVGSGPQRNSEGGSLAY